MRQFSASLGLAVTALMATAVPAEAGVIIREVFSQRGNNTFSGFTASQTGTYVVTAAGGMGGGVRGGAGAVLTATFQWSAGDSFLMLIGAAGASSGNKGNGGGGTFLVKADPYPSSRAGLFIAAGGGGGSAVGADNQYASNAFGGDASFTTSGTSGGGSLDGYHRPNAGGTNGHAGQTDNTYEESGGGGFISGTTCCYGQTFNTHGASFIEAWQSEVDARTGVPTRYTPGKATSFAGGGGGGYSGGGGGNNFRQPRGGSIYDYGGGGGGGSFVAASGTLGSTAYNRSGDGYVRIDFIDRIAPPPPPPPPMPGVPEPSTWAMLICGFGLCGVAMRRRQTKVVHSFAN